jgi:DNA-binding CsgD family transcriptional regulator
LDHFTYVRQPNITRHRADTNRLPSFRLFSRLSDQEYRCRLSGAGVTPRGAGASVLAESMAGNLAPHMPAAAPSDLERLTPREKEIPACLARGESNKSIARYLDLAESIVRIHVQNILKKLSLTSRVQSAVFPVENDMARTQAKRR